MKKFFFLFILFMITSCAGNNNVYWCGDHPCINKKEKEAYFKKTMIVEVKDLKKNNYKKESEIEKIMQQARLNEKKRIKEEKYLARQEKLKKKKSITREKDLSKQVKLEEKRRIKEEKDLLKQLKLDEKRRIKEEKDLLKQLKLDEKRRIKEEKRRIKDEKKLPRKEIAENKKKQTKRNVELDISIGNIGIESNKFKKLIEKIMRKNTFRPYPDINNTPG